jgi:HisJ family histidinol phosphate phosphatase
MHSTNSIDGKNSLMEMCQSAVDKGLSEIAITDHFEPMAGNENCRQYSPEKYFKEVEKARERFGGRIKIRAGVELGQPQHFADTSEQLISSYHMIMYWVRLISYLMVWMFPNWTSALLDPMIYARLILKSLNSWRFGEDLIVSAIWI